jgi:hypothetical protein
MRMKSVVIGIILCSMVVFGALVSAEDTIVWEYDGFSANTIDIAPNGNFLLTNGPGLNPPILEIRPDKTVVHQLFGDNGDSSAQYLNDGSILVAGKYSGLTKRDFQGIIDWHSTFFIYHGEWTYITSCYYAYQLPNGHILASGYPTFEFNGVGDPYYGINPANVVWISPVSGDRAYRLENGNTLLVLGNSLIEEQMDGTIIWEYENTHTISHAQRLSSGNTLYCDSESLKEITSTGEIVWQYPVKSRYAIRLANGNTLISDDTNNRIIEVSPVSSPQGITFTAKCPVEISVIDPDGMTISKSVNEIDGATYSELGLGSDGTPDAQIFIPVKKIGIYSIIVTAKPGVPSSDKFTLEVSSEGNSKTIASDVSVQNIPPDPYRVQVSSVGKILIVTSGGIAAPEFPSIFLPAFMIIGFLGAVLLIQGTREQ